MGTLLRFELGYSIVLNGNTVLLIGLTFRAEYRN